MRRLVLKSRTNGLSLFIICSYNYNERIRLVLRDALYDSIISEQTPRAKAIFNDARQKKSIESIDAQKFIQTRLLIASCESLQNGEGD